MSRFDPEEPLNLYFRMATYQRKADSRFQEGNWIYRSASVITTLSPEKNRQLLSGRIKIYISCSTWGNHPGISASMVEREIANGLGFATIECGEGVIIGQSERTAGIAEFKTRLGFRSGYHHLSTQNGAADNFVLIHQDEIQK